MNIVRGAEPLADKLEAALPSARLYRAKPEDGKLARGSERRSCAVFF
jgi:hypothetical protein